MRNWFRKLNSSRHGPQELATIPSTRGGLDQVGMNFTMYRANGGYVVEFKQYDRKTDRHYNNLHIITEEKVLADELAKIITLETLRS